MGLGISIAVKGTPDDELASASRVEVQERSGEATTYRIRFDVDISGGDLPLLVDERLDAGSELSILVPVDQTTHCLVKGPVHGQQIHLKHGGGGSWVEVQGSDTSIVMDRETRCTIWDNLTDSDAVRQIVGQYGYTADVDTTQAGHYEAKHTLVQRESDFRFVRRLARRNGFLFWVTSDDQGVETAHFKRPALGGASECTLVINLDSPNLRALDLDWDVERPTSVEGAQLDLNTKTDLSGAVAKSPQTVLGDQGLAAITGDTRSVHLTAPADDAGDLQARGEGALIEADWFLRATCQTSLSALGALVRAATMVELKGAGKRHSGLYFVAGVRHTIDAEDHRMDIELVRNGWSG